MIQRVKIFYACLTDTMGKRPLLKDANSDLSAAFAGDCAATGSAFSIILSSCRVNSSDDDAASCMTREHSCTH